MTMRALCRESGVAHYEIYYLLRAGKLTPPAKDESGRYVWGPEDVARVHAAKRSLRPARRATAAC